TESPAVSQADLEADNGIIIGNGLNLPNGFVLSNGVILSNGFVLSNGVQLSNGILLSNGINLSNGVILSNGFILSNGVTLTNDVSGPFIAPAPGSDLEVWIDANPTNNLRTLKYLVGCALDPSVTVYVQYRDTGYWFTGVVGFGPSWLSGPMTSWD